MMINLDDIALTQPLIPPPVSSKPQNPKIDGWFIKGPLPGEWLGLAASLPGKALHVAMAICFQVGLTKQDCVMIPNRVRRKFGLSKDAYLRGLRELELAELVTVQRKPGACGRVTVQNFWTASPTDRT